MRNSGWKKWLGGAAVSVVMVAGVAGCGSSSPASAKASGSTGSNTTSSSALSGKDIVVGLSNSFVGNVWRAQMEADFKTVASQLKSDGKIKDYIISNANQSVPTQIQQIKDMIKKGVNVLIIDAASATALNPVVDEAVKKGITVLSFDNTVSDDNSINILLNEDTFDTKSADALAKLINEKGNVVLVNGVAGTPVNNLRQQLAEKAFQKYPGIKIVAQVNANWSAPIAQQKMASILTAYPKIDAVWDQGGEAQGVMQAFMNAHRSLPPIYVDGGEGAMKIWMDKMKDGYKTIGSTIPPSEVQDAVFIGVKVAEGGKLKSKNITVPAPWITNDNVSQFYDSSAPEGNFVDPQVKESDVDQFFQ